MEKNSDLKTDTQQILKKTYINDDNVDNKQYPLCVASFPRSGNTMLRTILENTTGNYTGDDMIIKYDDESELQLRFFDLGVHNTVKNTFLIKTHFPNFSFPPNEFKSQGAVFIIRNPFDAFDSYFEMVQNDSHRAKLSEEVRKEQKTIEAFQKFIEWLIPQYHVFHEYWINGLKKIPVKIFKYEWFTNNKESATNEIFEFLFKFKADKVYLGGKSNEEIKEIIFKANVANSTSYKPGTSASHYISLEKNRFSQEQLDKIIDINYDVLSFFGYIEEFKQLKFENLKLAIEKKEKKIIESGKRVDWGYKFDELEVMREKLLEKHQYVTDPLQRDYLMINDKSNDSIIDNYQDCIKFFNFDIQEFERKQLEKQKEKENINL